MNFLTYPNLCACVDDCHCSANVFATIPEVFMEKFPPLRAAAAAWLTFPPKVHAANTSASAGTNLFPAGAIGRAPSAAVFPTPFCSSLHLPISLRRPSSRTDFGFDRTLSGSFLAAIGNVRGGGGEEWEDAWLSHVC